MDRKMVERAQDGDFAGALYRSIQQRCPADSAVFSVRFQGPPDRSSPPSRSTVLKSAWRWRGCSSSKCGILCGGLTVLFPERCHGWFIWPFIRSTKMLGLAWGCFLSAGFRADESLLAVIGNSTMYPSLCRLEYARAISACTRVHFEQPRTRC